MPLGARSQVGIIDINCGDLEWIDKEKGINTYFFDCITLNS